MLDFVGLSGREKDKVAGFSHGMKQRLGIAQTLLHDPELIILDEPTTGLDPQGIIDIRNLILRLSSQQHKTILLSSHDLSEMEIIANRMVIINNGKTLVEGGVNEMLNTGELVVTLDVDNRHLAKNIIANLFPIVTLTENNQHLKLMLTKLQIAELTKALIENGIAVFSIESKRKLEDYFIKMINKDAV